MYSPGESVKMLITELYFSKIPITYARSDVQKVAF
jgi:hypothetical protein